MARRFNDRIPIDLGKEVGRMMKMSIPELADYIIGVMVRKQISSFEDFSIFSERLGRVAVLPKGKDLLLFPFKGYYRYVYSLSRMTLEDGELVFYVSEELYAYDYSSTKYGAKRYTLDELLHLLDTTPWKKANFRLKNDTPPWTISKHFLLREIASTLLFHNPQRAKADKAKIVPLTDKELDFLTKKHFYNVKNIDGIIRKSILK